MDAAYDILTPWGSQKLVLPCRTANICRLLCNCYYFTGDAECGELAGKLVTEALGYTRETTGTICWDGGMRFVCMITW